MMNNLGGMQVVRTLPDLNARAVHQQAWVASTDQMMLAAAGNFRMTLANPAGSGRLIVCPSLVTINTSSGLIFADVRINPNAGLPVGLRPVRNLYLGGPAGLAVVHADTNLTTPVSGGTLAFQMPVPPGRIEHKEAAFVIPPGVTVGINVPFAGAASGQALAYLTEVPV